MTNLRSARLLLVLALAMLTLGACDLAGGGGASGPEAVAYYELDRPSAPALMNLDGSQSFTTKGVITSYRWNVAGTLFTGATVEHIMLPSAGDYPVSLTVTDSAGGTDTVSGTVSVLAPRAHAIAPIPERFDLAARLGQSARSSFTLGNSGSLPLLVTVSADSWLSVNHSSVSVPGESLQDFQVTATCGAIPSLRTGSVTLTTSDPDAATIQVPVTLNCDVAPPSEFAIDFLFSPGQLTLAQRDIFRQAGARWAEVITGDLPNVSRVPQAFIDQCARRSGYTFDGPVDDLLIIVDVKYIDGEGKVLGRAGPCFNRNSGAMLPVVGYMEFDSADFGAMERDGTLLSVVLHEMGHVLGFTGYTWEERGYLTYNGGTCLTSTIVRYRGPSARTQWHALGGSGDVPVEDNQLRGTACAHWDEDVFGDELMTGYLSLHTHLSAMTVGALADLSYQVDYAAADPYSLPPAEPLGPAAVRTPIHEELLAPIGTIDADGTVTPFEPGKAPAPLHLH